MNYCLQTAADHNDFVMYYACFRFYARSCRYIAFSINYTRIKYIGLPQLGMGDVGSEYGKRGRNCLPHVSTLSEMSNTTAGVCLSHLQSCMRTSLRLQTSVRTLTTM